MIIFLRRTQRISHEYIHGELKFTPCQAELLKRNGVQISNSSIEYHIDDDEYCKQNDGLFDGAAGGALDNSVQYWTDNFNTSTNRYEVAYMFDDSHSSTQKNIIRQKLMEFKQKTCVDLVEIPWEETKDGPFAGKYDNVFWVSSNSKS